jgi:hypothetical protein
MMLTDKLASTVVPISTVYSHGYMGLEVNQLQPAKCNTTTHSNYTTWTPYRAVSIVLPTFIFQFPVGTQKTA